MSAIAAAGSGDNAAAPASLTKSSRKMVVQRGAAQPTSEETTTQRRLARLERVARFVRKPKVALCIDGLFLTALAINVVGNPLWLALYDLVDHDTVPPLVFFLIGLLCDIIMWLKCTFRSLLSSAFVSSFYAAATALLHVCHAPYDHIYNKCTYAHTRTHAHARTHSNTENKMKRSRSRGGARALQAHRRARQSKRQDAAGQCRRQQ
jgi:hypothetical protein